jgi:hypothetical protein
MNLPIEILEMLGQTMAKVVPVTLALALVVLGTGAFLGLQSRQALVAQARTGHRPLLLVPGAAVRACLPHRPVGARRRPACLGFAMPTN